MSLFVVCALKMLTNIAVLCVLFLSGAGADCSKSPALFITAPKQMRALSGSCLQIPCEFRLLEGQTFDSSKPFFGIWIKKDPRIAVKSNIIFNSSGTVTTYPINITGDMRQSNCTTVFSSLNTDYTQEYYFRIENEPFKATASCHPIHISVQDSPWNPLIETSGELRENKLVTINCSALTPCPQSPPKLTWDLPQGTPIITDRNTNGTFTTETQKFTLTDSHDGLQIKCSAEYPVTGGHKKSDSNITLSVKYAPKNTTVSFSPSGLLSAGQLVNLSCSSRAKPPVDSFTWFRISSEGHVNVSEGAFYRFIFNDATQGRYYCEAMNNVGKQTSAVIHLQKEGVKLDEGSSQWAAVAAGIVGTLIITCAVICWFKWPHKTSQQTQSLTGDDITTDVADEVHYGQIDFSKLRLSGRSVQDKARGQDTVYAQVKVSKMVDTSHIYAKVKKK